MFKESGTIIIYEKAEENKIERKRMLIMMTIPGLFMFFHI
jgi:hypothetical protein